MINKFNYSMDVILKNLGQSMNALSVGVAVSGGSDSLALTFLLKQYFDKLGISITAYTLDHALRPESGAEALFVKSTLNLYGINTKILFWDHADLDIPFGKIELLARKARYQLICNSCLIDKINILAVGHTMDDQTETYMIRKAKNSGEYGLACMSAVRRFSNSLNIIRPLLLFSKEELKEYLVSLGINWISDPSNEVDRFTRVKFRKYLNVNAEDRANIQLEINKCAKKRQLIEQAFREFSFKYVNFDYYSAMVLKPDEVDAEDFYKFIQYIIWMIGGAEYPCSNKALVQLLLSKRQFTMGRCVIECARDNQYTIFRENKNFQKTPLSNCVKWDNRFIIFTKIECKNCYINNLKDRDIVLLRKEKVLNNNIKINILRSLPAVYNENEKLLSVPSIGYNDDNFVIEFNSPISFNDKFVKIE